MYVYDEYLLSDDFAALSFFKKCFIWALWGKSLFYKYYFCWMFSEGAACFFGITCGGVNPKTNITEWNALTNIKIGVVENAYRFHNYVEGFNVQTNFWVAHYVYKRLKFLNNRHISQAAALGYLAFWHGFHSGYFVSFIIEFLVIRFEKELETVSKKSDKFQKWMQGTGVQVLVWVVCKVYMTVGTGFCLTPFQFLKFGKYWHVNKELYFSGIIFFVLGNVLVRPLFKAIVPPNDKPVEVKKDK
jgi:lysophospholipid acyltransferase 5